MWTDKGWKRITADEAARIYPRGGVSAHSGLFMCELCGQYVLLTDGNIQVRHFRHSSSEKSKDCPERTFGTAASVSYSSGEHELPIRLKIQSRTAFSLEMGFIRVPKQIFNRGLSLHIKAGRYTGERFVYSGERLDPDKISYVSIGTRPYEEYRLSIENGSEQLYNFWPQILGGLDPTGTIFDGKTLKKLPYDADVEVGKRYYLLKVNRLYYHSIHINVQEVCSKSISWDNWYIYEVKANNFGEDAAKFFLEYHCRLTESPIELQPVWPLYVEQPYAIKHSKEYMTIHVKGIGDTHVFPWTEMRKFENVSNGYVMEITCRERQQLMSVGRAKAIEYLYFWKEKIDQSVSYPEAFVKDIDGNEISLGIHHNLPRQGTIRVSVKFDGVLYQYRDRVLIDEQNLRAGTLTEITNITWNTNLRVYVGNDKVTEFEFVHDNRQPSLDEKAVIRRLERMREDNIAISHTTGNLVCCLKKYPLLKRWLYQKIREGTINRNAYRELQKIVTHGDKD